MGKEMNEMCNLSDYVEELGIQKGIEQGKEQLLKQMITKKLSKGMSVREIADDLEESKKKVREMIDAVRTAVKDNQ